MFYFHKARPAERAFCAEAPSMPTPSCRCFLPLGLLWLWQPGGFRAAADLALTPGHPERLFCQWGGLVIPLPAESPLSSTGVRGGLSEAQ